MVWLFRKLPIILASTLFMTGVDVNNADEIVDFVSNKLRKIRLDAALNGYVNHSK
ncbi:hypothetical protein NWP16_14835 [Chrysosporum ovalisporum FSS-45]|uniref:hypothetical protein n=1 Tax=Umezakia ovalisporum TaxID=75695 RepID=UPI0024739036|nr:hypothetical protein [Umezakia ovalisporum]MDH6079079.1 hypothetical protein [Umezakia ovalisporum FSS-45]